VYGRKNTLEKLVFSSLPITNAALTEETKIRFPPDEVVFGIIEKDIFFASAVFGFVEI
jgi:hypothetical protein